MAIKKFFALLCCVLTVFLTACGQQVEPTSDPTTESTFPTLDESRTPMELLLDAVEKTRALPAFSVEYMRLTQQERVGLSGTVQKEVDGTYTAETCFGDLHTNGELITPVYRSYQGNTCTERGPEGEKTLQSREPYTLDQILEELKEFNGRTGLIRQFSSHSMNVIPSYDGSFCYRLENLTQEEMSQLLYGAPDPTLPADSYAAAITVAPEGHISTLEFTGTDFQVRLTIQSNVESI